jgi:hypothetical protein
MLRVAVWALRARFRARRVLWSDGIERPVRLPAAPQGPADGSRAVTGVLRRTGATCLVQSVVLQRWFADNGQPFDVVVGVTSPSDGFRAHAWLDRPGETGTDGYSELHRISPPQVQRP